MPWKDTHKFYWRSPLLKTSSVNHLSQKGILFVDVTVSCTCSGDDSPCIQVIFGALLRLEQEIISSTSKSNAKTGAIYVQSPTACTNADLQTYASQLQIDIDETPPTGLADLMATAFLSLKINRDPCEEDRIVLAEDQLKDGTLNLYLLLHHEDLGETRILISNGTNNSEWERTSGFIGAVALDMFLNNLDPGNKKREDAEDESERSSVMVMIRKWWDLAWNHYNSTRSKFNFEPDATRIHDTSYTENISCTKSPESVSHSLVSSTSSSRSLTPLGHIQKVMPPPETSLSSSSQETKPTKAIVRQRKVMHGRVRGNARPRRKGGKLKFKSIMD